MADCDSTRVKTCTKCGGTFPATPEFFHAYKRSPDGRRSVCRQCRADENIARNAEFTARKREHYAANKDRLLARSHSYYKENIEEQRAQARERHHRNREVRLIQMREYREVNRDSLIASQRERSRASYAERYGSDIAYTLGHRMRALMRRSLKLGAKSKRMVDALGYGPDELKVHLERQFTEDMSWNAFLSGRIHIDHIVPIKSFNITSDTCEDFRRCWCLSNLRPIWSSDNLSKGAKQTHLI